MSLNRVDYNKDQSEVVARKKIQSLIKGKLLELEEDALWVYLTDADKKQIRRAIIRIGWDSYKVGLLTTYTPPGENGDGD